MSIARLFASLGAFFAILKTLFAYLDPGSGSLIVQVLVAIIVGILATFRLWKSRFLSLLRRHQECDDEEEGERTE